MPASTPPLTTRRAACALAARTLAWALLFGGWLALGALGMRHAPAAAGALAPVALWLLTLGLASRASASWWPSPRALRAVLVGSAALTATSLVALAHGVSQALWPAAVLCGLLLMAASRVVRGWRQQSGPRLSSPIVPAGLGAVLAWMLAGDPLAVAAQPAAAAGALLVAGVVLAALVPRMRGETDGAPGCRSGLFDCALAWPTLAQWREPAHWPWLAASLAMLPMMAALPLLAEGCARAGWSVHAVTGLHLLAMLAPAGAVAAIGPTALAHRGRGLVALLLVAGGGAALAAPGSVGTMAAMVLQAAAWGIAWACTMAPAAAGGTRVPVGRGGPATSALASATAVLVLGVFVVGDGWAAWSVVHVALGTTAALGVAAALHRRPPVFEELRG